MNMRASSESLISEDHATCLFTTRHQMVIWFSLSFYVADLCLDLYVCGAHFQAKRSRSAWFIFFCILLPNLYAGYKSLQWYLRAHEETPIRRPVKWIVRVLFFPISPILRYLDAWVYGRRARLHWQNRNYALEYRNFEKYMMEIAEVALLRLVIIFLEDAPIVVLNLAMLLQSPPPGVVTQPPPQQGNNITTTSPPPGEESENETVQLVRLISVVAKLICTMTLGVVHYVSCNKLAWHLANTKDKGTIPQQHHQGRSSKGVLSWPAEMAIYCWQLLAIGSRVIAYALLWVVHFDWLWLPITLRWCLHALWIYFDVAGMSLVNSIAFGGVYLFSFVTTAPGRQILRISLYYTITFGEHIIIALLWHFGDPTNYYHDIGLGVMFGGSLGGLLFLSLYYSCCHPDREEVWLRYWWRNRKYNRQQRNQLEQHQQDLPLQ
ncbi:hypothetical protein Pmani_038831 [Petrolisthes manimaculis]|uniref:XK-related protein n=1 Tax=Petrolisthes manimaculis TaxID=1843537 RepID=A0AAE1TLX3_9EUCA|nr:hypothetical protein Pmani_038831 [Petrolisthes manimaculis]